MEKRSAVSARTKKINKVTIPAAEHMASNLRAHFFMLPDDNDEDLRFMNNLKGCEIAAISKSAAKICCDLFEKFGNRRISKTYWKSVKAKIK